MYSVDSWLCVFRNPTRVYYGDYYCQSNVGSFLCEHYCREEELSDEFSFQFLVNIVGGIVLMHRNWCNSWTSR